MAQEPKLPIRKDRLEIKLLIRKSKDVRRCPNMPYAERISRGKRILDRMNILIARYDNEDEKPPEIYDLIAERDEVDFQVGQLERSVKLLA